MRKTQIETNEKLKTVTQHADENIESNSNVQRKDTQIWMLHGIRTESGTGLRKIKFGRTSV